MPSNAGCCEPPPPPPSTLSHASASAARCPAPVSAAGSPPPLASAARPTFDLPRVELAVRAEQRGIVNRVSGARLHPAPRPLLQPVRRHKAAGVACGGATGGAKDRAGSACEGLLARATLPPAMGG